MRAKGFPDLSRKKTQQEKDDEAAEREALRLYEEQLARMCWTKFGYKSETHANSVIGKLKAPNLRSYKCPACQFWHLTKKEKS